MVLYIFANGLEHSSVTLQKLTEIKKKNKGIEGSIRRTVSLGKTNYILLI